MIVVADTGPLRYLILIEYVHVLPSLYGRVLVPPAVVTELDQEQTPELVRRWMSDRPEWLEVVTPRQVLSSLRGVLGLGECEAISFLGKLDLNYVWLHAGTLGRRTGWSEYWEARKSLDAVLKQNPSHVRACVARAWIDYIVDTRLPRGTRWMFGGGDKKRGLRAVEEAARLESEPYAQAEARFALWDMQMRERHIVDAVETARGLSRQFPENRELVKFLNNDERLSSR